MARGKSILDIDVTGVEKRRHPSKHYVYIITVSWNDGSVNIIYRRYSKFFDFQVKLLESYPREAGKNNPEDRVIPFLPGKIIFGRSHIREVALKRLDPINKYCKGLIHLPSHISESQCVVNFFEPNIEDLIPPSSRSKKQAPAQVTSISEPVLLEQFTVLVDYTKEGANEISLHEGETIDVIEKNASGWWFVSGSEGQGWIPSSYLDLEDGTSDEGESVNEDKDRPHLAIQGYTPQMADELSLETGAVVHVVQKNLDGWWKVRSGGKEGLVPGNYLTRTDTIRGKHIQDALRQQQGGATTDARKINHDDDDEVTDDVRALPSNRLQNNPLLQIPFKPKARSGGGAQPKIPAHIQSRIDASHPSHVEETPPVQRKPPPPRKQSVKQMTLTRKPSLFPPEEPVYMTVADYNNTMGDGISFVKGSKVQVLDKHETGWWYVTIGNETGWVPSQYVEKKAQASNSQSNKSHDAAFQAKWQNQHTAVQSSRFTQGHQVKSAKPLPATPTDVPGNGADFDDSFDSEDEPVYANEDPDEDPEESRPPPVPSKGPAAVASRNPGSGSSTKSSTSAGKPPVTSPRMPRKQEGNFASELAAKFGGLKTTKEANSAAASKPQLPQKNGFQGKPELPAKEHRPQVPGQTSKPQSSASSSRPKLPNNRPQPSSSKPQPSSNKPQPKGPQSSNILAMRNLFEGSS